MRPSPRQLSVADIILYRTIATDSGRRKPGRAAAAASASAAVQRGSSSGLRPGPSGAGQDASVPQRRAASLSAESASAAPLRDRAAALRGGARGGSDGDLLDDPGGGGGLSGRRCSSTNSAENDSGSGDDFFEDAEEFDGDWDEDGSAADGELPSPASSSASASAPAAAGGGPGAEEGRIPRWGSTRRGRWLHTGVDYVRRGAAGVLGYMPAAVADSRVLRFPALLLAYGAGGGDPQLAGALQKIEKTARDSAALAAADGAPSAAEVQVSVELLLSSVALELRGAAPRDGAGPAPDAAVARVDASAVVVRTGERGVGVTAQILEGWDLGSTDGAPRRFLRCPAEGAAAALHEQPPALEAHVTPKPGGGGAADVAVSLKLVRMAPRPPCSHPGQGSAPAPRLLRLRAPRAVWSAQASPHVRAWSGMLSGLSGFGAAVPTDTLLLRRCAAASGLGAQSRAPHRLFFRAIVFRCCVRL